ncbi:MAG: hypothetical protein WEB60_01850 [Terrimicrobiaceae bacterium]
MKTSRTVGLLILGGLMIFGFGGWEDTQAQGGARQLPENLKPWESWATWNDRQKNSPTPFNDPSKPLDFWPSVLSLQVDTAGGRFVLELTVFSETWVPLPGSPELWPQSVKVNGVVQPVIEQQGRPVLRVAPGNSRIEGEFPWSAIPQSLDLPKEIGILQLTLEGQVVTQPTWGADGKLWIKRDASTEQADKDFLGVKIYGLVEDGIPLWLKWEVELLVSGKSREEDLGNILPEGWALAGVRSPLPVAVDESGRLKAQVRPGKWLIEFEAFRINDLTNLQFGSNVQPAVSEILVGFRSQPDFRMVDITGAPAIDVSQTTFPDKWRSFPVYQWDTTTTLTIVERLRGMGLQKPAGLRIHREFWLDEDGKTLTFRDQITGQMQQIWRLDVAPGQDLGAVRSQGLGQLITKNPENGASGIEVRTRDLNLEATGRSPRTSSLSATGWRTDAEALTSSLNLPPGWRLFALFGADWVKGDWLTAWSLLDLFLLLIFSLSVFRLWGWSAALLAFVAFGLSYHEPSAPRFLWLALLVPLALLRVVTAGWGHKILLVGKWVIIALLVFALVPFLATQLQQAIFPQLEPRSSGRADVAMMISAPQSEASADLADGQESPMSATRESRTSSYGGKAQAVMKEKPQDKSNLLYDAQARIQTGPAVPDWTWRTVSFGWNGPVQSSQQVRPLLISLPLERLLTLLRVALLLALAFVLLRVRGLGGKLFMGGANAAAVMILPWFLSVPAMAQFPEAGMLETLRERLLEKSDAYPNAASIPSVSLALDGRKLTMEVEIHTAIPTAVPLPGRLPAWSPVSVTIQGKPEVALRREDGYLWVVLPAGVHRVVLQGQVSEATEWEWTFLLRPHRVAIEAPGWVISGVKPNGVPDQQVFFALQQQASAGEATYDRQDFQSVVAVERAIELGLVWQVETTVRRLSQPGKAIVLRIPLLPGENVLSANAVVAEGTMEVRLGAQETSFTWNSELSMVSELTLTARSSDTWVERWTLTASPVWNVALSGLPPVFEPSNPELVPVWHPWPGESVDLTISRPEAIPGDTVTISKISQETSLGKRQRTSRLNLTLRCTLGQDFAVTLPEESEVTSLDYNGQSIPVRKDAGKLIIPLRPGDQTLGLSWKTDQRLAFKASTDRVDLPVPSANIESVMTVPQDRWVLWTHGPLRGPAVRFWVILATALIAAAILSWLKTSPLRLYEWMLLAIGLTQVPLPTALIVVGWLFFLVWRGRPGFTSLPALPFNLLQVFLIFLTLCALGVFVAVVGAGLLGSPEMFIVGNGSTSDTLRWYQASSGEQLPQPSCLSVSIWWYRIFMLVWALWLAASLIRWLRWGWHQFSAGGCFHGKTRPVVQPPPLQ